MSQGQGQGQGQDQRCIYDHNSEFHGSYFICIHPGAQETVSINASAPSSKLFEVKDDFFPELW